LYFLLGRHSKFYIDFSKTEKASCQACGPCLDNFFPRPGKRTPWLFPGPAPEVEFIDWPTLWGLPEFFEELDYLSFAALNLWAVYSIFQPSSGECDSVTAFQSVKGEFHS